MNKLFSNQDGAGHVAAVLVVVLVAVVGFAGFRVYSNGKTTNKSATQTAVPAAATRVTKTDVTKAGESLDDELTQADVQLDASQLDADLDALL